MAPVKTLRAAITPKRTEVNRAESAELNAANKRIQELETEAAVLKRHLGCGASCTTQKAVRGHSSHGRRRADRTGRMPAVRGHQVGLPRTAQPGAGGSRGPPRLAHRADPGCAHRLSGHLRRPPSSGRTFPRARAAGGPQPARDADGPRDHQRLARYPSSSTRHEAPTAPDPVERMLTRDAPNRLWVIDITEPRTYEGKVYCAVVLDMFSRRVVGWSDRGAAVQRAGATAILRLAGSFIPIAECNSPSGPSPIESSGPGWSRRWVRLATATTMRSSKHSGAECKPSYSTVNVGKLESSWPTRSSTTWRSSTTAEAALPLLRCALRLSLNCYINPSSP